MSGVSWALRLIPMLLGAALHAQAPGRAQSPVVLFAAAHADDETVVGPALARYARTGARVLLVYATDGAQGVREHARIPAGDSLARVRVREVRCAAATLGAEPPVLLGFRDGIATGPLDTIWRETIQLRDSLVAVISRMQPTMILTWGPDGGTGHPDHRLVSALVTELFQQGRLEGVRDLYYVGWPATRARPTGAPPITTLPGTREELLTFQVAVDDADWSTAEAAFRCHWSQFTAEEMTGMSRGLRQVNGDHIHFRRAVPR